MTYVSHHPDRRPARSRLIPVSALGVYLLATGMLALLYGERVAAVFAIVAVSVTWAVWRNR